MLPALDLATVEAPFFESLTGRRYLAHPVDLPGQPVLDLELIQTQGLHHHGGAAGRTPFSLLFRPVDTAQLQQGIYECDGPGFERAAIFLVPVRDPSRGLCMQAIFN